MPWHWSPGLIEHQKEQVSAPGTATVNAWMYGNEKIRLPIMIKIGGPNLGPSYTARLWNPGLPRIAFAIVSHEQKRIIFGNHGC
jgi:hypothetical protein